MDFWISFANFFASAIRLTAPIALGTLACTISERAGVINIGIEGSMLFSGFLAAVGSYYTGSPWVGLLCGCAAGAFLALILGVLAIYCNGQQIVIGIGLNLFGPGFAYMLMRALWDTTGISPWVEGFQAVNIPLLSRIPIAGTMLSGYPACIYLGLLAVAVMQYLLHRTAWGLRIRAVGENPAPWPRWASMSTACECVRCFWEAFLPAWEALSCASAPPMCLSMICPPGPALWPLPPTSSASGLPSAAILPHCCLA